MSAAFDSGVAFFGLLSFFIFSMHDKNFPFWWGNPEKLMCPLDAHPLMEPKGGKPDPWGATKKDMFTFPYTHTKNAQGVPVVKAGNPFLRHCGQSDV
ncbi:hypothetical protein BGZ96_010710 [Linnemannia gamsii]|uniref:Uncharacterized protein n=1 Tax=Linnemannia gamsii TaxID=64522 RepID=A0ABQ7JTS5_9FUNG|nr:hypothetical protein BGZ96_010710 [Linnemannia gamsii]